MDRDGVDRRPHAHQAPQELEARNARGSRGGEPAEAADRDLGRRDPPAGSSPEASRRPGGTRPDPAAGARTARSWARSRSPSAARSRGSAGPRRRGNPRSRGATRRAPLPAAGHTRFAPALTRVRRSPMRASRTPRAAARFPPPAASRRRCPCGSSCAGPRPARSDSRAARLGPPGGGGTAGSPRPFPIGAAGPRRTRGLSKRRSPGPRRRCAVEVAPGGPARRGCCAPQRRRRRRARAGTPGPPQPGRAATSEDRRRFCESGGEPCTAW